MDEPGTAFDAERPPTAATAADALAIIEGQQARTAAQLRPNSGQSPGHHPDHGPLDPGLGVLG